MAIIRETEHVADTGGFISRVSWGSIILGVVIALGVMLLLALLGIALGFSVINPADEAQPLSGVPIGTAIYFVISNIIALAIGGFAAARLASSAWTTAAVFHGAAVWALAAILMLAATASGVGAIISGTTSLVSTITGGAAQAVKSVVPDNMNLPDLNIDTLVPDNFISTLPPEVQQSLEGQNLSVEDIRREAQGIMRDVISEAERQQARQAVTETATAIATNPASAPQQIDQLYNQLVGENGLISQQDREQALQALEQRLGIQPAEAEAMFDQWQNTLESVAENIRTTLNEAQAKAAEFAQNVAGMIASAAWWAFIVSLLGLAAAIGGAIMGRPDRHSDGHRH